MLKVNGKHLSGKRLRIPPGWRSVNRRFRWFRPAGESGLDRALDRGLEEYSRDPSVLSNMKARYLSWILRLVASVILLQTLYFKFTAHPDSVALFTKLGMEPGGRILVGLAELLTAVLLILRPTIPLGALLGTGLMAGALMSHLTRLGFEGDMMSLAVMAGIVLLCCLSLLVLHREQYRRLLRKRSGPD